MDWILNCTVPSKVPDVSVGQYCFTDGTMLMMWLSLPIYVIYLCQLSLVLPMRQPNSACKLTGGKTVIQSLSDFDDCPQSNSVGSETVECVDQFTYLGTVIHTSTKSELEIRKPITMTKNTVQQCYKSVWHSHIAVPTKLCLYNRYILPMVLLLSAGLQRRLLFRD